MQIVISVSEFNDLRKKWEEQREKRLVLSRQWAHFMRPSFIHAKRDNDRVVVSIFVNPKQFGPNEDFDVYPNDSRGCR